MADIVIIGAGPAGLTAALKLSEPNGDNIIVLEESGAIGGISRTVRHNGNRMDIGGHRFFSKDDRIMDLWKDILPLQGERAFDDKILNRPCVLTEGGPDPEVSDDVMLVRHRISRIYYKKHFFDYPVSLKWETIKNMGFFTTLRAGLSYIFSAIFKRKETNLENFYINRFGKVLYGMFFEGYTAKLWGRSPKEISAEWGAQRVKGLSIRAMLKDIFAKIFKKKNRKVETSLIEEF
ncbi:MAG: NAD(P)-binding protein, partial [Clostridia bacterium]|nr:NAD(P)-binding protein [Clostridia bacterium]